MKKENLAVLLIMTGGMIFIIVSYINSKYAETRRPFSGYTLLASSWEKYKDQYIRQDGRVVDLTNGEITTSEGQSYAMLRAVIVDDKNEFDQVWLWTLNNLKRPNDNLFGWQWGETAGKQGFLANGGDNSASDADSDIALALIWAGTRWGDRKYIDRAKLILNDLWNISTDIAGGHRYLVAGNWANSNNELVINPSYFSPAAWKIFAKIDRKHDWQSLVDPAYQLLTASGENKMNKEVGVGLPPNWVVLNKRSGQIVKPTTGNLNSDYSFDAMRVPWKIELDYQWNHDVRAKNYLINSLSFLGNFYKENKKLPQDFTHDGQVINQNENPAMYATTLGYFLAADPKTASQIYQEKIVNLFSNDSNTFNNNIPYYELNWLWLGSALYNHQINLFL